MACRPIVQDIGKKADRIISSPSRANLPPACLGFGRERAWSHRTTLRACPTIINSGCSPRRSAYTGEASGCFSNCRLERRRTRRACAMLLSMTIGSRWARSFIDVSFLCQIGGLTMNDVRRSWRAGIAEWQSPSTAARRRGVSTAEIGSANP